MDDALRRLFDLTGQVAAVTGASRGLGRAIAVGLARVGCHVVLGARSVESLQQVAREIEAIGRKVVPLPLDVTEESHVKAFMTEAVQRLGQLDILVNNAGVFEGTHMLRFSRKDWDHVVAVNLTGTFLCSKEAARHMIKRRQGKVINMASVLGTRAATDALAYSATKGGVIQMTRVMALELGPFGIQVNAMAPGLIETEMTREFLSDPEQVKQYLARAPSGRYGQPEDVVGVAIFLASPAANHITGQTIVVDGGVTLM